MTTDQPRQLRIALAMRGGVSLAVWMGGACREVARLRAKDGGYAGLLTLAGYDDPLVVVDVLAGTSAGGLNGVLMSDHLARGASFDQSLRNLWLTVGDLDNLSRRPLTTTPPASLLLGSDAPGFYWQLHRAMTNFGKATGAPASHPVRLLVTATRLNPRPDAVFPVIGRPLGATSARAFFRFRYHGPELPTMSDFATDQATSQLAYAGRTTSSFPAAFEPALPHVGDGTVPDGRVDLRGISSETGAPDAGFDGAVELMDGGVLDNIPIAWAVRSVSGMPADQPVDRWLLYLQPVAPTAKPAGATTPQSAARVVRLLRAMLSAKLGTESILDDADELRATDADARRHDAALGATVTLAGASDLTTTVANGLAAYGPALGSAEVVRLRALLTDPRGVIGPDPLPIPAVPFPLRGLMADETPRIEDVAPLRMPATPDGCADLVIPAGTPAPAIGSASRTPLAAARAVTFLLRLVRTIEHDVPGADTADVRRRLYDLRFAVEVVVAARDRLLLTITVGSVDHGPAALLRTATSVLAGLLPAAPAGADPDWLAWSARLAEAVDDAQPGGPTDADAWPEAPYAALWSAITDCAASLVALDPSVRPPLPISEWLAATEVVGGAMRPDPLASPAPMQFAVASAANQSPLETELLGPELSAHPELRIDRKLSGNQVSNFASFLSARWRLNDWTWGRLDGAQTLVEIVARRDRLADVTAEQIHDLFVAGTDGEWRALLEQRWSVYAQLAEADPPQAAQQAIVERAQWDILREEIPLTVQLSKRRNGKDRPPSASELDVAIGSAPPTKDELAIFANVGAESVIDLLRRADLRRTLLRLGLVGWRALLPGGGVGITTNAVLVPTVGTVLFLPLLLALVAPVASITAGTAMWVATSAASGRSGLLEHLPTAIAFVLSWVMFAWQLWAAKRARERLFNPPPAGTKPSLLSRWGVPILAGVGGAGLVAVAVVLTHDTSASFGGHPAVHTGWLAGIAVLTPLIYVATGTGPRGLRTSFTAGRLSRRAFVRGLSVVAVSVATGVVTWLTVHYCHQHWWTGFLAIYEALALTLIGLLIILSARPDDTDGAGG